MARALDLAEQGLNTTTPNPRVGCVIVKDNLVVGEGWHRRAGEPHAEIVALAQAAGFARGATVYLTLEPCSHYGRTPPCVDSLIEAKVGRVVAAMEDPNPQVNGRGLAKLRAAGIDVRCGLLRQEATELNAGFVSRMARGLPWVRLKTAASLEGGTECLLVPSGLAAIACVKHEILEGGDHWIIVGRVVALHQGEPPRSPLLFYGGRYYQLDVTKEHPAPPRRDM